MRRLFDIVMALLALLLLSVLLLIVIVVLALTGERKVWFRQERTGYGGKSFRALKFVTMRADAEYTGNREITIRDDPRVLPVGRVLRKAKLNELPQILNVLKGDMAIVGWRPLLPRGFSDYPEEVRRRIVGIRPGLTGIGSIVFRDEEAILTEARKQGREPRDCYREDILPYKGVHELWYQDHASPLVDLKLIALTACSIVAPRNRLYRRWFSGLPEPRAPLVRQHCGYAARTGQLVDSAAT